MLVGIVMVLFWQTHDLNKHLKLFLCPSYVHAHYLELLSRTFLMS